VVAWDAVEVAVPDVEVAAALGPALVRLAFAVACDLVCELIRFIAICGSAATDPRNDIVFSFGVEQKIVDF
jgi:hypothetical protein